MIQAYSLNITVPNDSVIPFNNVTLKKGCTVTLDSVGTVNLKKCGVYMVEVDCSTGTAGTIQLFRDGIALPQAQATGTSPSFTTLIQVSENDCNCNVCTSPTTLQVKNVGGASVTFTDCNIVVTKVV